MKLVNFNTPAGREIMIWPEKVFLWRLENKVSIQLDDGTFYNITDSFTEAIKKLEDARNHPLHIFQMEEF